jgi:hypothetical protein
MYPQKGHAIQTGLGPIGAGFGAPTGTAPLTGQGILNSVVGTTPELAYDGPRTGRIIRCRLECFTASRAIAWIVVDAGSAAPTITATGANTDGVLIKAGTGPEWFSILDTQDLYIVADTATTEYQLVAVAG